MRSQESSQRLSGNLGLGAGQGSAGAEVGHPKLIKRVGTQSTVRVAAGESHTLTLSSSGVVSSFGLNTFGQLGAPPFLPHISTLHFSSPAPDTQGPVMTEWIRVRAVCVRGTRLFCSVKVFNIC
jgi:alpha-tubulin suppressor-like RCC1 family protein